MNKLLIIGLIFAMGMMFSPNLKASTLQCSESQTVENNIKTVVMCETNDDPDSPFYGDKKTTNQFDLTKQNENGYLVTSSYSELFRNGETTPWRTENNAYLYNEANNIILEQRDTLSYNENQEVVDKRIDVKIYDGTADKNIIQAYSRNENLREQGWCIGTSEYVYEGQTLVSSKADFTNALGRVESTNYTTYNPETGRPTTIVGHIYHPEGWLQIEETRTNLVYDKYNNLVSYKLDTINFVTEGPQNDDQQSQEEAADLIDDPEDITNEEVGVQSYAAANITPKKFTAGTPKLNKGTHYKTISAQNKNKNNTVTNSTKLDVYNQKLAKTTTVTTPTNKTISKEHIYYASNKMSSKTLESYATNGKIANAETVKYQNDGKTLKTSNKTIYKNGKKSQTIAKTYDTKGKVKLTQSKKF